MDTLSGDKLTGMAATDIVEFLLGMGPSFVYLLELDESSGNSSGLPRDRTLAASARGCPRPFGSSVNLLEHSPKRLSRLLT